MSVNLMSAIFETEFFDLKDENGNITKASTAKIVLLAMADHANDEGEGIYPSITKLCKKTALSEQTIRNTFDALRFNGIISLQGISKYGTNNHSINTACFPKAIGKETVVLTLYPLDPPLTGGATPPNRSLLPPHPLDPNHNIIIQETSLHTDEIKGKYKTNPLTEKDLEDVNKKVSAIISGDFSTQAREAAGTAWRGRELTPPQYLIYGDWWHKKTGLHMYGAKAKSKLDAEWTKSFKDLYENEVTLESLDAALEANKWRPISKLSQLTSDAKLIQATPEAQAPVVAKLPNNKKHAGDGIFSDFEETPFRSL